VAGRRGVLQLPRDLNEKITNSRPRRGQRQPFVHRGVARQGERLPQATQEAEQMGALLRDQLAAHAHAAYHVELTSQQRNQLEAVRARLRIRLEGADPRAEPVQLPDARVAGETRDLGVALLDGDEQAARRVRDVGASSCAEWWKVLYELEDRPGVFRGGIAGRRAPGTLMG
jgi:hypothetical protein